MAIIFHGFVIHQCSHMDQLWGRDTHIIHAGISLGIIGPSTLNRILGPRLNDHVPFTKWSLTSTTERTSGEILGLFELFADGTVAVQLVYYSTNCVPMQAIA